MATPTNNTISDTTLTAIVTQVAQELEGMMKSEVKNLAKAIPGEETPGEESPAASSSDPTGSSPPSPDASASASSSDAPPDASASASPAADAPPAGPDASASAGAPPTDPAAAGADGSVAPLDPQALLAEYSKLSPEDQNMHYIALKELIFQRQGDAGAASAAGAPDASAPGAAGPAAAPPPDASAAPAIKAEIGMHDDPKANGENPLHKAEKERDLLKAELDAQAVVVGKLMTALKPLIETPLRKSITSTADLPADKTPVVDVSQMSRADINARLKEVASTKLSKSDRELINGYVFQTVSADKIVHLLAPKQAPASK